MDLEKLAAYHTEQMTKQRIDEIVKSQLEEKLAKVSEALK